LLSVELVDLFMSILPVFNRLPALLYVAVSGPLNKVVVLPVTLLSVKNLFDLPFIRIVDTY
jgi:hypothetical protein